MKISAVVTTYNGAMYIEEQLRSILCQSRILDEVVISDDGSCDGTYEIVCNFIRVNDLHAWKCIRAEKNLGPSENNRRALMIVQGDIVFLADQDDIWFDNKVEVMTEIMLKDRKIMMLTSSMICIDKNGGTLSNKGLTACFHTKTNGKLVYVRFKQTLGFGTLPWCASCIRKQVRDELVRHELPALAKSIGIDGYATIIAGTLGNVCIINLPMLKRRVHASNISLGRMRKSTVLSSDIYMRVQQISESKQAHEHLLCNDELIRRMTIKQKKQIESIVQLLNGRINFFDNVSFVNIVKLALQLPRFALFGKGIVRGLRFFITDIMYAYGINWKVEPKFK